MKLLALMTTVLAACVALPSASGVSMSRRPATTAERAAILAGAPYIARVARCAPVTIAVDGRFAAAWTLSSTDQHVCSVDAVALENPAVLERQGTTWTPLAFPQSPPCSAHVPADLVLYTTAHGVAESACDNDRSRLPTKGFVLPSGNIGCAVTPNDMAASGKPTVYCSVKSGVSDNRWLKDSCLSPIDWQYRLDSIFRVSEACDPGTAAAPVGSPTLAYGKSLSFGGVTCSSASTGLTCENADGSGFFLSRQSQKSFEHPPKGWKPFGHGRPTSFTVAIGSHDRASCDIWTSKPAFVRCDGAVTSPNPGKPPRDCDLTGLDLPATGAGHLNCATDAVSYGPYAPLLPQGRSVSEGPFTCTSAASAFTCKNSAGHEIAYGPGGRWHVS